MKKDRNNVVERLRNRITTENKIFIQKNIAISKQIQCLLEQKGWTQKDLAKKMGKHESEVSKWLSGLHNLTLQSIALIEANLGEDVIMTPVEACTKYKEIKYVTFKVHATSNYPITQKNETFDEDIIICLQPKGRRVA